MKLMKDSNPTDAAVLLEAAKEDQDALRGSRLFTYEEMNGRWGLGKWRAVPRFALHQGEKVRPIDNARKGKHNDATTASDKLVLCNAAQPVIDARALAEAAADLGIASTLANHRLHTGGEDMPNAFRTVPCSTADYDVNIVGIYDPTLKQWRFQEMWALMFGCASGVTNFN